MAQLNNFAEQKATNRSRIVVELGKSFWSERSPDEARREAERIIKDIRRHVDNVGACYVETDSVWVINGNEYSDLGRGLYDELADDDAIGPEAFSRLRYKSYPDAPYWSGDTVYGFYTVLEHAYRYPYEFTASNLTEAQQALVDKILAKRKAEAPVEAA